MKSGDNMNKNFMSYFDAIGLTETLRERIETIFEFYRMLCPEDILRVFISDYINQDGTRVFASLWFFSKNYLMEAKEFATKDDFDLAVLSVPMRYLRIMKSDYDFSEKATDKSRLHIEFTLLYEVQGVMKASRENCKFLREVILGCLLSTAKNDVHK